MNKLNGLRITIGTIGAALLWTAGTTVSQAHITLERATVETGTWTKLVLRVAEGCGLSPTTSISVELPTGIYMPRPMPKGGWALNVKREKLETPAETHGIKITEAIRTATWSGNAEYVLPQDFYEEFIVFARMPSEVGKYPIKVSQICKTGRIDWHEVAKPGQSRRELKAPALELTVVEKITAPSATPVASTTPTTPSPTPTLAPATK